MDFAKPDLLYLMYLLIPISVLFLFYYKWQKNIINNKFNVEIFSKINPDYSVSAKFIHFGFKLLVIICLIFAMAGPRIGTKLQTVKREGVDIIFALDVSKSMLVEDVAPSRLLKSIQIISKSIDGLVSDRLGLIVYAGQAYPLMPLTFDYSMAKLLVKTIDSDIVPSQGTDVSSAILLADSFFDNDERSKILFLITDGEDHEGNFDNEISQLSTSNIIISSVNIGTQGGGPIPIQTNQGISYKTDSNGDVVISKSNSKMLKEIATATNGDFIKTKDTQEAVDFIFKNMEGLDKTLKDEQIFSDYEDQFQWFLGFALFFIFLDLMFIQKKINFIQKIIK